MCVKSLTQGLKRRAKKNHKILLVVIHLTTEHARRSLSFMNSRDVLTTQPRTPTMNECVGVVVRHAQMCV